MIVIVDPHGGGIAAVDPPAVLDQEAGDDRDRRSSQGSRPSKGRAMSYRIFLVDPPWRYRAWSRDMGSRTAESFYPTMRSTDIQAMRPRIDEWAAPHCALFLWVTAPCLPEGIAVMEAWGFRYVTIALTWVKTTRAGAPAFGMGRYTRGNVELCLLGIRGRMPVLAHDVSQVILAPRRDHSRKPDEQYQRIERLYDGPYLELFARRRRPGWDAWGNEVQESVTDSAVSIAPLSVTRTCEGCREPLKAPRADARYCSAACRQRSYRRRAASLSHLPSQP
jgi:N6-adenosine-specific RNA methylase IME4